MDLDGVHCQYYKKKLIDIVGGGGGAEKYKRRGHKECKKQSILIIRLCSRFRWK